MDHQEEMTPKAQMANATTQEDQEQEGGDDGEEVRRYRAGKAPRQIVEAEA